MESQKKFNCEECDYKTDIKCNYQKHLNKHIKKEKIDVFKCDKCEYETKIKCNYEKHYKTHSMLNKNFFNCEICNYKTYNKSNLTTHLLIHNESEEKYKCDECDYKTNYKSNLTKHKNMHNGEVVKNYKCLICDLYFNSNYEMNEHITKKTHKKILFRDYREYLDNSKCVNQKIDKEKKKLYLIKINETQNKRTYIKSGKYINKQTKNKNDSDDESDEEDDKPFDDMDIYQKINYLDIRLKCKSATNKKDDEYYKCIELQKDLFNQLNNKYKLDIKTIRDYRECEENNKFNDDNDDNDDDDDDVNDMTEEEIKYYRILFLKNQLRILKGYLKNETYEDVINEHTIKLNKYSKELEELEK